MAKLSVINRGEKRRKTVEKYAKKRAELMLEAEKIWMNDQAVIPLLFYSTKNLVSSKLKGFTPNLRGAFASRWYELTP